MLFRVKLLVTKFEGWVFMLMIGAILLKLGTTVWLSDKGFDIMDEGSHLLMYKYPEKYVLNIHNFHYLLSWLPTQFITLKFIRNLWIFSQLISIAVLLTGIASFYRQRLNTHNFYPWLLILFCCNGLFVSVHDRFLAYNDWLNLFIYSSIGLFLISFKDIDTNRSKLILFISGFLIMFPLLIKPSAGVIILFLMISLLTINFKFKKVLLLVSVMLSGLLSGGLLFVTAFLPPLDIWLPNYLEGAKVAHLSGYVTSTMIKRGYVLNLIYYAIPILISTVPVFLIIKRLTKSSFQTPRNHMLLVIAGHLISSSLLLIILFKMMAFDEYNFDHLRTTTTAYYDPVMLIISTIFYIWVVSRIPVFHGERYSDLTTKSVTVLLCLLSFAIFFGAMSTYQTNLFGHLPPFLAVLFILIQSFKTKIKKGLTLYFSLFITVLCSYFYINYIILNPPHILEPLTNQLHDIGSNETILVDSSTAVFISELRSKMDRYPNTESMLHIGNHPGMVYLLGKYQPGVSIYNSFPHFPPVDRMLAYHNNFYYNQYKEEIEQSIILLNAGTNIKFFYNDSLKAIDLGKYELVDSVFSPYLNKEQVGNSLISYPYTYIYVPNELLY